MTKAKIKSMLQDPSELEKMCQDLLSAFQLDPSFRVSIKYSQEPLLCTQYK